MSDTGLRSWESLREFPSLVRGFDVSTFDEAGLQAMLADVRTVQRCLDGLATRIGVRANQLAADGRSAPAEETARAGGTVSARQSRQEAARAEAAERIPGLVDAMSEGAISGQHADSITRHAAKLTNEERASFDFADLIAKAEGLPPETFDRLVKRQADRARGDHGQGDANTQRAASEFRHWVDRETGMGRFTGSLDPERYERLVNAVEHHMNALTSASEAPITKTANLAAEALVELVTTGGESKGGRLPAITVIVDHDTIIHGGHDHSIRETETGLPLGSEAIARLCCDATIRKVVLDGHGIPINVGRKYRTATDAQWAAIKALHNSCAWQGCEAPINWCQAHHIREWDGGGATDLNNLVPLCNRHHHRVHEGQWHIRLQPDRSLQIHKPCGAHHATVPKPQRC